MSQAEETKPAQDMRQSVSSKLLGFAKREYMAVLWIFLWAIFAITNILGETDSASLLITAFASCYYVDRAITKKA